MALLGEFMARGPKNKGGRPSKKTGAKNAPVFSVPTLEQLGLDKHDAQDVRAVSALKTEAPELHEAVRESKSTIAKAKRQKKERERTAQRKQAAAAIGHTEDRIWARARSREKRQGGARPDFS